MNSHLLNYRNRVLNPANPINWEHSLNRGLVGCWMDPGPALPGWRGGVFQDMVIGGQAAHPGTLNSCIWTPSGVKINNTSTAYIGFGDYSVFEMASGQSFTLVAEWKTTNTAENGSLLTKGYASTILNDVKPWYLIRYNGGAAGRPDFLLRTTSGTTAVVTPSSGSYSDGKWHQVVAIYDGAAANIRIFIDGVERASPTTSVTADSYGTNSQQLSCGNHAASLNGAEIRELRVYKGRAFNANEVAALYDQSCRGYPDTMQWISSRAAFSAGAAPPTTPGVFNAAWWMVPNKNIGICRAV